MILEKNGEVPRGIDMRYMNVGQDKIRKVLHQALSIEGDYFGFFKI